MTFLPIVERELRARARSRTNYWGRFAVVAVGLLISLPPLLWSGRFGWAVDKVGRGTFDGLVVAAFLLCCAACLLTADSISSERREGTLGLLLLTRVRYFDVLAGKFASSGLTCVLGLVAFLPVLMVPIMAGGVTGGEAARKSLALLNTLFLALNAGLWASSRGFERFRTAGQAVTLLAMLVFGPILLGTVFQEMRIGLASPIGTLVQANDAGYKTSAGEYWFSLVLVQAVGWALLSAAVANLRSRLGTEDGVSERSEKESEQPANTVYAIKCRYCGRENEARADYCRECGSELRPRWRPPNRPPPLSSQPTALHWLLRRQRGLKPMLWLASVVGLTHAQFYGLRLFQVGYFSTILGLPASVITASIIAWAASRFFVEARRTGELELLLTTPLGREEIVSTQWAVLRQLLSGPVLLMALPASLQAVILVWSRYSGMNVINIREAILVDYAAALVIIAEIIVNVGLLCRLGLWFGFRGGQGRAIFRAVVLAKGLPYVLTLLWWAVVSPVLVSQAAPFAWLFGSLVPQIITILLSLWLIRAAREQLQRELAGAEPLGLRQVLRLKAPSPADALRRVRNWPEV